MLTFAVRNLFSRPLRSLLALLGLTVAIAGMVGLFSVAAGLERMVGRAFGRAPGVVAMQHGALIPLFSRLPAGWDAEIAALPGVRQTRSEIWSRIQTLDGKVVFNPPRLMFGPDIAGTWKLNNAVFRDDMREGRFLKDEDRGTFACVISRQVAKEIKKGVGETVQIDGYNSEIVGVFDTGSVLLDMAILMHDSDVRTIARFDDKTVSAIYIEPEEGVSPEKLITDIRDTFRGRATEAAAAASSATSIDGLNDLAKTVVQSLQPKSKEPTATEAAAEGIEARTARDWGNRLMEFNADLDLFLWLMTLIGVAIALLSILNTMLMSVSERMIEFGVLKANGWTRWNILQLITLESAALGVCGGVFGCLVGWIGTLVLNSIYEVKLNLYASPGVIGFSLIFSILLGMLGGLYPAWWAVRMSPMQAIRRG